MYPKDKAFKYLKNKKKLFGGFQVTFHMYLHIGRDDDDDYGDEDYYE